MYTMQDYNEAGKTLEESLKLRNAPIALKLINKSEMPERCYRPSGKGKHHAMCQTFSVVRRNKHTVALFPEDHWCLWPLICFGNRPMDERDVERLGSAQFIKDPQRSLAFFKAHFPMIKSEIKKDGMVLAPLSSCAFIPDMVLIYCVPGQLRQLLMSAKFNDAILPLSALHTVASCAAATLPVLNGETDYCVAIPDPGEFERGLAWDDEMIFSVKGCKTIDLTRAVCEISEMGFGFMQLTYDMNLDYPRPKFYNDMFEKWGLDVGEEWDLTR
jgi:uncharacterized protein (DUF169 family)